MCGIAGIVHLSGNAAIDPTLVQRMAQAIVHRGPDEDGFFFRPGLAMASRRLSIVGLKDGRQPISNERENVSVVFNGELFDYPDVRRQLADRGHQLRTSCDTEIIPHLYEDHGQGMLDKLRGQFAFALWDDDKRQLLLARDRFGICPLYWTRTRFDGEDWLLFASEVKALLASGMVTAEPDLRGINHAFTFFALPGPVTCFKGIEILLPGHVTVVSPGSETQSAQISNRAFWQMDFPNKGDERPRRASDVDEFQALLTQAVEKRLRADVPVVSYLSGGVDSSTILALGCQLRKNGPPIPSFTISIQDARLNEESESGRVAKHLGVEPFVVKCGRQEVLDTYPDLVASAEGPVIDTACASLLLLAREVHKRGYKVALTGEGADEWLAGYPWFKYQQVFKWIDTIPSLGMGVRKLCQRFIGMPRFSRNVTQRTLKAAGGVNAWMNVYGAYATGKLRFFSRSMADELGDHMPWEDLQLNAERARRWHPLNRSVYVGGRVMLPGLLLAAKGDRVAMHSSVETRYPFLDEDVFDFAAGLDPAWKLRRFRDKVILRQIASRWIPHEIARRPKAMFRAPLDSFPATVNNSRTFADELVSASSLRKTGYFDADAVAHWRAKVGSLRNDSMLRTMVEMALVAVVSTQLWHHLFVDGTLADLPSLTSDWSNSRPSEAILQGPWVKGRTQQQETGTA